jgi:hypothetical protein
MQRTTKRPSPPTRLSGLSAVGLPERRQEDWLRPILNPGTKGSLSRYPAPSATGFDFDELTTLNPRQVPGVSAWASSAQKFFNIGDTGANSTVSSTTWDWVPPSDPTPIANVAPKVPGDGTQPAWTARHLDLGAYPGHVITVSGSDVDHMFTMNSPKTLDALAGVLGV